MACEHDDNDTAGKLTALASTVRTAWEQAVAAVSDERRPLDADLVRRLFDPWSCPSEFLPYLAAHSGVRLWFEDWPEERKRRIIAEAIPLARVEGTLAGIRRYLGYVDGTVVSVARPRDKFWWSGGQTPEQRAVTIAAMPQIHIALSAGPIAGSRGKAFWAGRGCRQAWRAGRAWLASDASARHAARATYVDRGIATPVTVRGLEGLLDASLRLELRAPANGVRLFWGARRAWGASVFQGSDADEHVLTITTDPNASQFAVPRGLIPSTVRPVRVADMVAARPGQRFWGTRSRAGLSWGGRGTFRVSDADAHVYDRVVLFDATRLGPSRQPYSFWGVSRFGRPAYTAELRLDIDLKRPARQHGYGAPWGRSFWRRSDMTPLWRALAAIRLGQGPDETIWVDTRLYEPIRFSPGLRFGDPTFKNFGDLKRLQ